MCGCRLAAGRRTRLAMDLRFRYSADCTNASHHHPENKGAEKQSDDCARKSINELDERGTSLTSPLEQNHSNATHERVDGNGKHGSAYDRQHDIWCLNDRPDNGGNQPGATKRSRICGAKRSDTHRLADQTDRPAV